jgi:hypothetical protein
MVLQREEDAGSYRAEAQREQVTAGHPGVFQVSRPNQPCVGYIQGDLLKREQNGISHSKCDGFKVECYESFVVVYVDSAKQPTWTGNYVLTIPWNKIEHMTLQPARAGSNQAPCKLAPLRAVRRPVPICGSVAVEGPAGRLLGRRGPRGLAPLPDHK